VTGAPKAFAAVMYAEKTNKTRFFPHPSNIAPFLTGERGHFA
jgi:hypothetical protein